MYIDNNRVKIHLKKTYTIYLHVAEIATVTIIFELACQVYFTYVGLEGVKTW